MQTAYHQDEVFEKIDCQEQAFNKGEYEQCRFVRCNFTSADLSYTKFIACEFEDCNFSLATLKNTTLQDAHFKKCKLLGLRFDECNLFLLSFRFDHSILDHASFHGIKMKKTMFQYCSLKEVDFTQTELSGSSFDHCDLTDARFERSLLEQCDFRSASHYTIDPENNAIKKARFALDGLPGLLVKYNIRID